MKTTFFLKGFSSSKNWMMKLEISSWVVGQERFFGVDFLWEFTVQKQNEKHDFDLFSSGFLKMNIFEVLNFTRVIYV
jgi:hypothetical protein